MNMVLHNIHGDVTQSLHPPKGSPMFRSAFLWLDFLFFGSGRGLRSPAFNQVFVWLVDKQTERGNLYTTHHGFGAQLYSFHWFAPKAGSTIHVGGHRFRVFSVHRSFLRVKAAWGVEERLEDSCQIRKIIKDVLDS